MTNDSVLSSSPLWSPSPDRLKASALYDFARRAGFSGESYEDIWRWSVSDLGAFWSSVWDYCEVIGEKGDATLENEDKMQGARFFPNARLNWAENLLRRRDEEVALIFLDEAGRERQLSFRDLAEQVSLVQQALKAAGVKKGDRVAGYMPNIPEALIGALATASLGAVWSSASPDFGVQGVVDRFGQIEPKILLTVDGYFYAGKKVECLSRLAEILPRLPSVKQAVIFPFLTENPVISGLSSVQLWRDFVAPFSAANVTFERVEFSHPLFIMFSSGTTGVPKCIVHGHGGTLLQHVKEHRLQCDIRENDRVFYFTTCGWMMWNWQISALASGATLLLYDGSPFYPTPYVLWDYAARHQCTLFGTGAKYIDALKANGVRLKESHDLSALRTLTSTGSPLVQESFDYVYDAIKKDLHLASISGGTDILSCFVIGNPLSPVWRGEIQGAGLGYAIDVFSENGTPLSEGAGSGELVCTKPFPSMPVGFWADEDGSRYHKAYFDRFPNVWCHGDWIERTLHGGFIIHGRSDATLNPGGVRIGTAEIYRQVEQIPEVLESIAVGQSWENDERVVLFVRLREGVLLTEDLIGRIKSKIRAGASPRHVPAKIVQVADIPRTKSNKIVELAVREVIHNRPVKNVEALANPEALSLYRGLKALAE